MLSHYNKCAYFESGCLGRNKGAVPLGNAADVVLYILWLTVR